MPWPIDDLVTTSLDEGTDTPPRSEFLKLFTRVKELIAGRATASGVCDLDANIKVPLSRLYTGTGNGLDADTVDGYQGSQLLNPTQGAAFSARVVTSVSSTGGTLVINSASFPSLVEDFDSMNWFALSTGRFTPTEAGYYCIMVNALYSGFGAGYTIIATIRKNSSAIAKTTDGSDAAVTQPALCTSAVVYLNGTTDYIDGTVYGNDPAGFFFAFDTRISGFKIR